MEGVFTAVNDEGNYLYKSNLIGYYKKRGGLMKKILTVLALCLLAGCSGGKESVEVDYVHSNHLDIAAKVLGNPLGKDETKEIFDTTESIDLYYDREDDENVKLTIYNNMDYYYTGSVELEACEFKLTVTGLAPNSYASKTLQCPEFVDDDEFSYEGQLSKRNDEYAYDTSFEIYWYEDDDTLFDYVLDLEEIKEDDLKALANYLYTENVLGNFEGETWVRVYPKAAYDAAYELNTDAGWNQLDSEAFAGTIWVDAQNDIAEIYGTDQTLIERINFR